MAIASLPWWPWSQFYTYGPSMMAAGGALIMRGIVVSGVFK
jgi:hypothetical protein